MKYQEKINKKNSAIIKILEKINQKIGDPTKSKKLTKKYNEILGKS